jgi:multidrug efflux pump subunit AcrB
VEFYGQDAPVLKQASEALKTALAQFPEVSSVEDNLAYDKQELILTLTPQGQALGFTTDTLGRVLRHRLTGIEAATYPDGPRSAEIRVELPEGELGRRFPRPDADAHTARHLPAAGRYRQRRGAHRAFPRCGAKTASR